MKKQVMISALSLVMILSQSAMAQGLKVGDNAPDFKLKNVDGRMVSMADYKDAKGFIIVFTCNHCPTSIAYEDRLNALDAKYKLLGFPVIAINPNDPVAEPRDSFDEMVKRAREKSFSFPYLFDDGQKVYPVYGATRTPHVFILQRVGNSQKVRYIGAIDNNFRNPNDVTERYVEDAVNALLAGKPVKTPTTVAVGCTIKTRK